MHGPRLKNESSAAASFACSHLLPLNPLPNPNLEKYNDSVEKDSLQGSPGELTRLQFECKSHQTQGQMHAIKVTHLLISSNNI